MMVPHSPNTGRRGTAHWTSQEQSLPMTEVSPFVMTEEITAAIHEVNPACPSIVHNILIQPSQLW